jgi:predicted nucleic acid-binding protein
MPCRLRLALLIGHPIHDCLHLALNLQTRSPMVTADRRFAAALARHDKLAPFMILLDQLV